MMFFFSLLLRLSSWKEMWAPSWKKPLNGGSFRRSCRIRGRSSPMGSAPHDVVAWRRGGVCRSWQRKTTPKMASNDNAHWRRRRNGRAWRGRAEWVCWMDEAFQRDSPTPLRKVASWDDEDVEQASSSDRWWRGSRLGVAGWSRTVMMMMTRSDTYMTGNDGITTTTTAT